MRLIRRDNLTSDVAEGLHSMSRDVEDGFVRAFAWLATTVYRCAGDWCRWRPVLTRSSAHLAVVFVAVVAIALSSVEWSALAAPALSVPALQGSASGEQDAGMPTALLAESGEQSADSPVSWNGNGVNGAVPRIAQPHTIIPDRPRLGVITYTVQAGDTVQSIAASYGLQPTTVMWANSAIEDAPDLLRIGQTVTILPIDGAYHQMAENDTLESIAATYKVLTDTITSCQYNTFVPPDNSVEVGMWLIIPGGEKPYIPKVVTSYDGPVPEGARGTGRFQWPVLGRITQGYWSGHRAIDIGAPTGSAALAADGGFISFAGWTDVGYGYLIVIDHANGFATYYAHLSNIYVSKGQAVERGQVIGAVGNTGHSTGPHLHFEIRCFGQQLNPRAHLP